MKAEVPGILIFYTSSLLDVVAFTFS